MKQVSNMRESVEVGLLPWMPYGRQWLSVISLKVVVVEESYPLYYRASAHKYTRKLVL